MTHIAPSQPAPNHSSAPRASPAHASLACMEVWGGSRAFAGSILTPGNDVYVSCTPFGHEGGASQGGDIYYLSNCAAGLITRFVLADVAGHGPEVAQVARDLRDLMRKHINTADQSRFASQLNQAFGKRDTGGKFATAILATYFSPTDHLIVCNAGHPPPLLYRAAEDRWHLLTADAPGACAHAHDARSADIGVSNLPLGVLDPTGYEQVALRLEPGDLVIIYTDALIEAQHADEARMLGTQGLLELAATMSPGERATAGESLLSRVRAVTGDVALTDDTTLIALRHTAADPPSHSILERVKTFAKMMGLSRSMIDPAQETA